MKSRLALAIVLMGLLAPARVVAGPTEEDAGGLIVRGVEHYKHQDYEGARVAFARAFELSPKTALLFNLALAEVQCGRAVDAVKHFRQYVSRRMPPLTRWKPSTRSGSHARSSNRGSCASRSRTG